MTARRNHGLKPTAIVRLSLRDGDGHVNDHHVARVGLSSSTDVDVAEGIR